MNQAKDINEKLDQLKQKIEYFGDCVCMCMRREGASVNDESREDASDEVEQAWTTILNEVMQSAERLLAALAEEIRWSLLDAHQEAFDELYGMLCHNEMLLRQHTKLRIDLTPLHHACQTMVGRKDGRQQDEPQDEAYCKELFEREYLSYKEENIGRIVETYQQDSDDNAYDYPDANERKTRLSKERRQTLFADFYGSYYHDHGRRIPELTLFIIDQKEIDYKRIHAFFYKYLSWEYADSQLHDQEAQMYKNLIFRENADVDKIMNKLNDLVAAKIIRSQRHWYIVYKVLSTKGWLSKDSQQMFRDQMNAVFETMLKCTKDDFKEIDSYFKLKAYADWSMDDPTAPVCCREYIEIAERLDREFMERQYAKPGLLIAPPKRIKK